MISRLAKPLLAAAVLAFVAPVGASQAAEKMTLLLNWFPTADHSPYFYARDQGWYSAAGIDLAIETGKGSGVSAERVGNGGVEFSVSDVPTVLLAKGQGASVVAVMAVYANSPQGFYWLKSSGIKGAKDFPGHKIGNPPGDAARVMWPAFAKAVGIDPAGVTYVNVAPTGKIAALKTKAVDVITDFYNEHDLKMQEFGDDLGFLAWREVGINPYGNGLIVNAEVLAKKKALVAAFVATTQKAFAACVKDENPCLKSLLSNASGLDERVQRNQWNRIKDLMRDPTTTTAGLGAFDPKRMQESYDLVQTYLGLKQPFDVKTVYTDEFLDKSIKMSAQ